jgi:Protein of unknown function (DUF2938)
VSEFLDFLIRALLIGIGATAFMDMVAVVRARLFGTPSANYALVGRWLAYCARGRFHHDAIAASPPISGEHLIGWTAHYLIGTAFAAVLLAIWGLDWTCRPTIAPALIVGLASVAAPFLLMQPGMGAGFAASRTPHPATARLRSLIAHAIFGVGLYVAAIVIKQSLCGTAMIGS